MSIHPCSKEAKPVARRGRPVGDREAKRAGLLNAAISVIAEEGYGGASLRNVAKRAGCTTGAVTYYFANKDEMVTAVAESLWDVFDDLLRGSEDRVDILAGLERWMDWTNADNPDPWLAQIQLLAHARHEPAFAVVYAQRGARYRRALTSAVKKGQREGALRDDIAADLLADQINAIADGWTIASPIDPSRFRPKRLRALLEATMIMISPPQKLNGK